MALENVTVENVPHGNVTLDSINSFGLTLKGTNFLTLQLPKFSTLSIKIEKNSKNFLQIKLFGSDFVETGVVVDEKWNLMRFNYLQKVGFAGEQKILFDDDNDALVLFYQDIEKKSIVYHVPNMQNITIDYKEYEAGQNKTCIIDKELYFMQCGIPIDK